MPDIDIEFVEILRRLNENEVRYVLIGGLAMVLHGSAHVTQDIDIGYARNQKNFAALASAMRGLDVRLRGVPADLPFVLDELTFNNTQNLTLITNVAEVDFLGHIAGAEDFDLLFERSILTIVDDVEVRIASLEDLIAMKRAANRLKDQNHILELEALKRLKEVGGTQNERLSNT